MKNIAKSLIIINLMYSFANASADECNNGDARACFSEAKTYDNNKDDKKALEFYNKACGLDYAIGCNKAGEKYLAKKDNENAKKLYSKACDLNHHESCVSYGEIYENEGDCDKAGEIYKDAFKNKKFKPASDKFEALVGNEKCMQIPPQQATIQQPVKEKNNGELQAFLDNVSLCDSKHDGKACMAVAEIYRNGIKGHIEPDLEKAMRYQGNACVRGKMLQACKLSAEHYKKQTDKKNEDLYLTFALTGCSLKDNALCGETAEIYYKRKDLFNAAMYFITVCESEPNNSYCKTGNKILDDLNRLLEAMGK